MANPVTEGTKAAVALRRRLGIDPDAPIDVEWAAQKLGVTVVRKPLSGGLSGIHLAHSSGRSFIAINSLERATRQNFTLAHEIGHHLFDREQTIAENIDAGDSTPIERRANAFAAGFILPGEAIEGWLRTPHLKVAPNEIARLALRYHMSYLATLYRLKTHGVIDDVSALHEAKDSIDSSLRHLLNRPAEKGFELPDEFIRMADEALERSIISRKRHHALLHPTEDESDF